MASNLRLKVSEERYRDTITHLGDNIIKLQGCLSQLRDKREQLSRNYTGAQATDAINAIKRDEEQAEAAIRKVDEQKKKIEQYLNSMTAADAEIKGDYKQAMDAANSVFN